VLAKSLGTTNPINMAKATVVALKELRRPEDVARIRGKQISEVLPLPSIKPNAGLEEAAAAVALIAEHPAALEPAGVEPAGVEPAAVEPAPVEPAPVEPTPAEDESKPKKRAAAAKPKAEPEAPAVVEAPVVEEAPVAEAVIEAAPVAEPVQEAAAEPVSEPEAKPKRRLGRKKKDA
jgi:hypothetical protein